MLKIRRATPADIEDVYDLIVGIAKYHKQEQFVYTSKEELLRSGFSDSPKFEILVAEYDKKIVGYVSYTLNYSIWLGAHYLNIDDLFVLETYRDKQIGKSLMLQLREKCKREGISKLRWEVQSDNTKAIRFYEKLGATMKKKGIFSWKIG